MGWDGCILCLETRDRRDSGRKTNKEIKAKMDSYLLTSSALSVETKWTMVGKKDFTHLYINLLSAYVFINNRLHHKPCHMLHGITKVLCIILGIMCYSLF